MSVGHLVAIMVIRRQKMEDFPYCLFPCGSACCIRQKVLVIADHGNDAFIYFSAVACLPLLAQPGWFLLGKLKD